jgi:hypothetical protein
MLKEDMLDDQSQGGTGGPDMPEPTQSTASKNALIHGIYASDILLPDESEEHFDELYQKLRSDLNPESPLEEEAVLDVVRFYWLKRRAIKAAKGNYRQRSESAYEMVKMCKDPSLRAKPAEIIYEPADLEQVIKLEAMIDTRIEKALARLVGIKEFRRIYGQKVAIEVIANE